MTIAFKTIFGATALAALGGTTALAQDRELTLWTLSYDAEAQKIALAAAAEQFEESHPGVKVTLVQRATDEHKSALRISAGADTGPDIYMNWAGLGLGGEYVKAGFSRDLSAYYDQYGWEDQLSAPSLAFAEGFAEGKHGVPFRFSGEGVYYNKALFEKAGITEEPRNYEELVAAAGKLKEAGIPAFTFGGTVNWHLMRLMDVLLETTCGAETHDQLMEMQLDWTATPCALEAFGELEMWSENYILTPFMGIDNQQAFSLFVANRAAMVLEGDWLVNQLNETTDVSGYGIFPFPTGTGRLYGFAEYLYISTKAEEPDLAAEFIDMFVSTEFQDQIKGAFGALSANVNVSLAENALDLHKEWSGVFQTAEGTFVNGDQAFPLDVTTEYFRVINQVASDKMQPQDAVTAMQTFIDNRS